MRNKQFLTQKNVLCFLVLSAFILFCKQAYAQKKMRTIAISTWGSSDGYDDNIEGFKQALREAGYFEGENVQFMVRDAKTDFDKQMRMAEEFVEKNIDLIYSLTTSGTLILKNTTEDIPIVFSVVTYPIKSGLIKSLESSGNNLTGTRNYIRPARQYYYFDQIFPERKVIAFVHRKGESNSEFQYAEFEKYLKKRKVQLLKIAAIDQEDILKQLQARRNTYDALYLACDTLVQTGGSQAAVDFARKHKKPVFSCTKDGVIDGAVIGNVADFYSMGVLSGKKAVMVLQGVNPSNISVEAPREDFVVLNKKTLQESGLTIPESIKKDIKEIIE